MTRRAVAAALAATAAPAALRSAPPGDGADDTLDAAARRRGLRFGTAVGGARGAPLPDAAYLALVARECGVVVHENALKWRALRPSASRWSFAAADALVQWAQERGKQLRGHTLLWHAPRWLPDWLAGHDFGPRPAAACEALLDDHIATVCARYGRHIHSFDVVNESVDPDSGALRDNVFTPHLGNLGQVELAFRLAQQHAPHAQRVYNDFMSWGRHSARHREGVLRLLHQLLDRGTPVQALGLQSHLGSGPDGAFILPGGGAERDWRRFLDEVAALGLDLVVTELDVNDRYLAPDPARRDAQAAALLRAYLDVTLAQPRLREVLTWGLADHHSWMRSWWPRDDGLPKRPSPYDEQLQPKPQRAALLAALQAMPARAGR